MSSLDALDAQSQAQIHQAYLHSASGTRRLGPNRAAVGTERQLDGAQCQSASHAAAAANPAATPLQCGRCSTAHSSVHVNIGSLSTISLADPIQKRLAHYFESGERRNWSATDFVAYLDTLYADGTTVGEARLQLHRLRQRANEPFTDFLVHFESQLAKADRLNIPDIVNYAGAVAAYLQGRGGQGPGIGAPFRLTTNARIIDHSCSVQGPQR
ncbi:hypothetical protein E4U11_007642 [Claviceps purpurea]|nr:hypothetical protein E4U11_007642 [Claviceps purpurea]